MIIKTPSRLHMSLIDMNGSYGRIDGGIGLCIQNPQLIIESEVTEKGISIDFDESITDVEAIEECNYKIKEATELTSKYYGIESGFHFTVHENYHPHSGLGSGTQIALATAKLITETAGIEGLSSVELSSVVGRGGTSGIGTYGHELGGLIVDGGHSKEEKPTFLPSSASSAKPPQLIARYDFPEDWNILVAMPKIDYTIYDSKEIDIFKKYCPVPLNDVEKVCHIVFMNMIPFILEKNIEKVGWTVDEVQKYGFNKIEHDLLPHFDPIMNYIRDAGAYGVGISSFGPALYSFFDDKNKDIVKAAAEVCGGEDRVLVTKAQNHGYVLEK